MDFFTQQVIQNMARKTAEEMERKKRLDPSYKPTSLVKLILCGRRFAVLVHGALVFVAAQI
jgi:hypothetical protein